MSFYALILFLAFFILGVVRFLQSRKILEYTRWRLTRDAAWFFLFVSSIGILLCLFVLLADYRASWEAKSWQEYKASHPCKDMGVIESGPKHVWNCKDGTLRVGP